MKRNRDSNLEKWLSEWSRFYLEVYGITVDFSDLVIPEKKGGFNWFLFMAEAMDSHKLYAKSEELWRIKDFDCDFADTVESVRKPGRNYAICLRGRAAADKENIGLTRYDCDIRRINGITGEERLLLGQWFYWKTGKQLDTKTGTLCFGSQCRRLGTSYVFLIHSEPTGKTLFIKVNRNTNTGDGAYRVRAVVD